MAVAVFVLVAPQGLSKTVRVDPETPFFAEPDVTSQLVGLADSLADLPSLETRRVYVDCSAVAERSWHPLMMASDFHRVDLGGGEAWFSEDFLFDQGRHLAVPRSLPKPAMGYALAALVAVLTTSVLAVWRSTRNAPQSGPSAYHLLGILLLVRLVLLAGTVYLAGSVIVQPSDEHGYFQIARDIASGTFSREWRYTLGLPLFYVPLVVLTQAHSYFDILGAASVVGGFVLGPLCLLLTFLVARRLVGSDRPALVLVALLAVLPFVYFPAEYHAADGGAGIYKALFGMLHCNPASYRLYYVYLWTGYNGMSDTLSTLLVLCVIWLLLDSRAGERRWWIPALAALLALACLVRVANVLLAPLFAYLAIFGLRERGRHRREYVLGCVASLLAFLVVFSPQLLVNALSFGSPLRFPYVLHGNRASVGFTIADFASGTRFLVGTNYAYVALGVAGLLSVRSMHLRRVLAFWSLPLFLFYAGYPVVGASPIRFTLPVYGAFLLAAIQGTLDAGLTRRELVGVGLCAGVSLVFVCPVARFAPPFPLGLDAWAWGKSVAVGLNVLLPLLTGAGLWRFSCRWRCGTVMATFAALYFLGGVYVLMLLGVAVTGWAMASSAGEVLRGCCRAHLGGCAR